MGAGNALVPDVKNDAEAGDRVGDGGLVIDPAFPDTYGCTGWWIMIMRAPWSLACLAASAAVAMSWPTPARSSARPLLTVAAVSTACLASACVSA